MSEGTVVTYELEGEVAIIGLNRPDKRNALSPDLMTQLREAALRAGDEAKCGIIFGHGDNFCAGLDLAWAAENWAEGRAQRLPFQFNRNSYQEVIARGNIPFIAALHGATLGGGLETAACAHIRVADESTFFGLPEGTRGIYIGGGGSVRVARLLGFARMQDMMLTGRALKPEEAERYGIVQYVVPKGQSMAKAKELAAKICKNAPLSNFAITNSLPRLQDMSYDDGLYFERIVAEYHAQPRVDRPITPVFRQDRSARAHARVKRDRAKARAALQRADSFKDCQETLPRKTGHRILFETALMCGEER